MNVYVCIISGSVQYVDVKTRSEGFFFFFLKRDDCSEISTAFQLCGIHTYVQSTASAQ